MLASLTLTSQLSHLAPACIPLGSHLAPACGPVRGTASAQRIETRLFYTTTLLPGFTHTPFGDGTIAGAHPSLVENRASHIYFIVREDDRSASEPLYAATVTW